MADTYLRVTGTVLEAPKTRSGVAKATGNPYSFTLLSILSANRGVTEVTLPDDLPKDEWPKRGESVDYLVTARASGVGRLNLNVVEVYDESDLDRALAI